MDSAREQADRAQNHQDRKVPRKRQISDRIVTGGYRGRQGSREQAAPGLFPALQQGIT